MSKKYNYIPSPTKTVTITETEWFALMFPRGKGTKKNIKCLPIAEENWLPLPRMQNYFVSDHGRMKKITTTKGNKTKEVLISGKAERESGGRVIIKISTGTNKLQVPLSTLIYETFVEKIPTTHCIIYRDSDKLNNSLSNLQIISKKDNYERLKERGETAAYLKTRVFKTKKGRIGMRKSRLSNFDVSELCRLVDAGISRIKIAEIFDISCTYIGYVVKGLRRSQRKSI